MPRGLPQPKRPPRIKLNDLQRRYGGKVVITSEGRVGHLVVHETIRVMWEDQTGLEDLTPRRIDLAGWRIMSTRGWLLKPKAGG